MGETVAVLSGTLLRAALARDYAAGVADGVELTLRLLLGEQTKGGVPYEGLLPEQARVWARRALARVETQKREGGSA